VRRHSASTLYAPLWFFVAYVIFTVCLALFGPLDFIDFPKLKVAAYIAFVLVCCLIGYYFGVDSSKRLTLPPPRAFLPVQGRIPKAFDFILAAGILGLIGYLVTSAGNGSLNTDLTALGETYNTTYEGYQRNTGSYSLAFISYSVFSAPMFIASVWGMFYVRRINWPRRLIVITIILGTLLIFTLGSGKMKQLGDFVIYVIAIAAVARAASGKGFSPRFIGILAGVAVIGLALFAFIVSQRYTSVGVDALNINQKTSWHVKYDTTHPVFEVFGTGIGFAVSVVCNYLSGGYYGLGLTLDSAPTWSHFLGSSYSISVIGERVFGLPSGYDVSYPYLVGNETGWGEAHWYTAFPWFASDFTFVGTGVLFGVFAFWYARAWLESIILSDPFSVLLFTLMTVGVFYVPANNQLMHSPGPVATLLLVFVLYMMGGSRRRWSIQQVWARARAASRSS